MIRIATLKAAGLSAEQIVTVLETEETERVTTRREQNRINQKNSRARRQHVSAGNADRADTPSSSPPSVSSPITPPSIPPSPPSPIAADAAPPVRSEEADLFHRGKALLGDRGGGLIKNLIKAKAGSIALARAAIETASTKQDPREYIAGCIHGAEAAVQRPNGWDPRL